MPHGNDKPFPDAFHFEQMAREVEDAREDIANGSPVDLEAARRSLAGTHQDLTELAAMANGENYTGCPGGHE